MEMLSQWELVAKVLQVAQRVLLYGIPGTGKTHVATVTATRGRKVYSVTLTEETPAAELRGHYVPVNGSFVWRDGPAVMARWRNPDSRLVLNEIDHASPDVVSLLHVICDSDPVARLTLPTGETLIADGPTQIVATMNGRPEDLPEALRDRFQVQICITEPHPDAIAQLPQSLQRVAKGTARIGDKSRRIGLRAWQAFAELRAAALTPEEAAQAIFGDDSGDVLDLLALDGAQDDGRPYAYGSRDEESSDGDDQDDSDQDEDDSDEDDSDSDEDEDQDDR